MVMMAVCRVSFRLGAAGDNGPGGWALGPRPLRRRERSAGTGSGIRVLFRSAIIAIAQSLHTAEPFEPSTNRAQAERFSNLI